MVDLNAPIWGQVDSAGNDADKWLRRLLNGEEEFREGMEVLAEDLSHQLSWYSATACVLPHLAALCKTLSPADRMFLIAQMGPAAAAEADCPLEEGTELWREFHEGVTGLRAVTVDLLQNHMDTLEAASGEERQMFALGALSFLGDRKHAYALWLLSGYCWEDGSAACACGWSDECFHFADRQEYLKPAAIAPWDGKSLEDEAVWFSGLLSRFGEDMILPILPLVYGEGVCPECGRREPFWAWHERFYQEY